MRVDIITIFPEYFGPLDVSLLGKARARGVVDVRVHDLRRWTTGPHRTVDDAPYGGGPGMVMRPEPWWGALTEITNAVRGSVGSPRAVAGVPPGAAALPGAPALPGTVSGGVRRPRVLVPTPSGRSFTQAMAGELAHEPWLVFCCGRYEGIDARVVEAWANDEVSIGDYVLAGGEVAALVMLEAVTRLLPGVVGNAESVSDDSFSTGLLEGPAYTRPPSWAGHDVPPVLLSGDHAAIARWRRDEALRRTARRRPELLHAVDLSERDRAVVAEALRGDAEPGTLPAATPAVPTSGEDVAE